VMLYNFASAIFSAMGDTRRPLFFLSIAGVINVVLNLILVICFDLGVAGVAIATVISQGVSAFLVLRCLSREEGAQRFVWKKIRINPGKLMKMIKIGLPAGINGSLFSISNILIQSSVNSFGSLVMAGNAASQNLEGFVATSLNSMYQASISFSGQNLGAGKYKRIWNVHNLGQIVTMVMGIALGGIFFSFSEYFLRLYTTEAAVVEYGRLRGSIMLTTYFLCGMMNVTVGTLRGMGYAIIPMIVSITGICVFRVVWIATVFQKIRTLECLYISYPISWILTMVVNFVCFAVLYRKLSRSSMKT